MKKHLLLVALTASLTLSVSFNTKAQCPIVPFAIVELFTSQGCSSCPTGDQLLTNLINQEKTSGRNVICIAEHVTYWDYLGWTDQYGQAIFGTRQNSYVTTAGIGQKGTPQLFVNGKTNVTSTGTLNNAVNNALGSGNVASASVCLTTTSGVNDPTINVNYTVTGNYTGANIIVCLIENGITAKPTAGELNNVNLNHDAVSRQFVITPITNATGTVAITPPANCVRAKSRIVAYIQAPLTTSASNSTIRGATRGLDLSNVTLNTQNLTSTESQLFVYPNPANTTINVNYTNVSSDAIVSLIDLSGRVVYSNNIANNSSVGEIKAAIDVTAFAKGVYILKLQTGNEVLNNKIIVE